MQVINPAVGCHYFPPDLQLPLQPLRGLQPVLLFGEQRHDGCEQFASDCYPTASRLRFEPGPFCTRVLHADLSATEPPSGQYPLKIIVTGSDLKQVTFQIKHDSNRRGFDICRKILSLVWALWAYCNLVMLCVFLPRDAMHSRY